ncbi:hypothetical protein CVT30_46080 [Streptomyces sp. AMCC400023]|nr:hypothetical protein CVT30_46080 [Streptomyces sp. AMCC400023]
MTVLVMQADATFWDSLVFDGIDDLNVESVTGSPATRRVRSERVTHKASVERYWHPSGAGGRSVRGGRRRRGVRAALPRSR